MVWRRVKIKSAVIITPVGGNRRRLVDATSDHLSGWGIKLAKRFGTKMASRVRGSVRASPANARTTTNEPKSRARQRHGIITPRAPRQTRRRPAHQRFTAKKKTIRKRRFSQRSITLSARTTRAPYALSAPLRNAAQTRNNGDKSRPEQVPWGRKIRRVSHGPSARNTHHHPQNHTAS